jgi:hypothetical protein
MARKDQPPAITSERGLYTISQFARFLNVSRLYLYRITKRLGPQDGVFILPSHSGAQMIRIDPHRFLHRSQVPHAVADRADAAAVVKGLLGEVIPLRMKLDAFVRDMERLYDELVADADDDSFTGIAPTESGQEPRQPKKAASAT